MKLVSMLAVASLLASGAAFAADAPAAASAAAPAAAAPMAKLPSIKHCKKEATAKGLKGKEAKAFVKDCHAGK